MEKEPSKELTFEQAGLNKVQKEELTKLYKQLKGMVNMENITEIDKE